MKEQGFSIPKILVMWTSIMLLMGILSAVGSVLFADVPEAYVKGDPIVGLSTLLGFLAIIVIKSLE